MEPGRTILISFSLLEGEREKRKGSKVVGMNAMDEVPSDHPFIVHDTYPFEVRLLIPETPCG